jgi:hypothetical protein
MHPFAFVVPTPALFSASACRCRYAWAGLFVLHYSLRAYTSNLALPLVCVSLVLLPMTLQEVSHWAYGYPSAAV